MMATLVAKWTVALMVFVAVIYIVTRDLNCGPRSGYRVTVCSGIENNQGNVTYESLRYQQEFYALAKLNEFDVKVRVTDQSLTPMTHYSLYTNSVFGCMVETSVTDSQVYQNDGVLHATFMSCILYKQVHVSFLFLLLLMVWILITFEHATSKLKRAIQLNAQTKSDSFSEYNKV